MHEKVASKQSLVECCNHAFMQGKGTEFAVVLRKRTESLLSANLKIYGALI
jgi:hypothetical protein